MYNFDFVYTNKCILIVWSCVLKLKLCVEVEVACWCWNCVLMLLQKKQQSWSPVPPAGRSSEKWRFCFVTNELLVLYVVCLSFEHLTFSMFEIMNFEMCKCIILIYYIYLFPKQMNFEILKLCVEVEVVCWSWSCVLMLKCVCWCWSCVLMLKLCVDVEVVRWCRSCVLMSKLCVDVEVMCWCRSWWPSAARAGPCVWRVGRRLVDPRSQPDLPEIWRVGQPLQTPKYQPPLTGWPCARPAFEWLGKLARPAGRLAGRADIPMEPTLARPARRLASRACPGPDVWRVGSVLEPLTRPAGCLAGRAARLHKILTSTLTPGISGEVRWGPRSSLKPTFEREKYESNSECKNKCKQQKSDAETQAHAISILEATGTEIPSAPQRNNSRQLGKREPQIMGNNWRGRTNPTSKMYADLRTRGPSPNRNKKCVLVNSYKHPK